MRKSTLLLVFLMVQPVFAYGEKDVAAEWKKLREELRRQGYPVAAYVQTPEQISADMARVRREMERRAGKPFVSDMQKVGGGSYGSSVRKRSERVQFNKEKSK